MAYFDCIVGGSGKGNTLVVTCADELAGATITCTNGTKTYTKTCPSTSPYEVTFYGLMAGTWTVSATVSGNTYTTTVVVVDCAALLGGFNWRTWVDTAQFLDSSDYNSLDEVLADEEAIRELCLEHACVDYMAEITTGSADVETIINTDLFAKWVNNSDYALDFLHANQIIAGYMDDADKYGYGEWVITDDTTTPPTWGAKGNVPVMTANNAPYGTAIANGAYTNYEAFRAFARRLNDVVDSATDSNHAAWAVNGSTGYIGYEFANPVEVTQIAYVPRYFNTECSKQSPATWQLEYSDDNSQWSIAQSYTEEITTQKEIRYRKLDTSFGYHRYWRMNITANLGSANFAGICALQFYGRELKVSVPKMTSNTAPYGEAIARYSANNTQPYMAFDNNDSTSHACTEGASDISWVGYKFAKPVCIKYMYVHCAYAQGIIQASNDGIEWVNLNNGEKYTNTDSNTKVYITIRDNAAYKYYRIKKTVATNNAMLTYTLQFYGLDYSEKEFEEGTTKKWLYDHGVLLDNQTWDSNIGYAGYTKNGIDEDHSSWFRLYRNYSSSTDTMIGRALNNLIDFTNYSLCRMRDNLGTTTQVGLDVSSINSSYYLGVISSTNYAVLVVASNKSNMSTSNVAITSNNNNAILDVSELWLE